ncbi:hypothetical protein BaRGS_00035490 [Batillaria attramentaria]|uniref:Uncharacterized protein n=1 Tax=Batillaria attramentaria TaxID=370345 RepID=A0ABD0JEK5_9CAEN
MFVPIHYAYYFFKSALAQSSSVQMPTLPWSEVPYIPAVTSFGEFSVPRPIAGTERPLDNLTVGQVVVAISELVRLLQDYQKCRKLIISTAFAQAKP